MDNFQTVIWYKYDHIKIQEKNREKRVSSEKVQE